MIPRSSKSQDLPRIWYATKDEVAVTEEKSPLSDVVAIVKWGKPVKVLEQSSKHCCVQVGGKTMGWVAKNKLSPEKPSTRKLGASQLLKRKSTPTLVPKESRSQGSIRG